MRRRILFVPMLALAAASALAYSTIDFGGAAATWPGARATVYHDPSWSGFPAYVSELRASMSPWSAVSGSVFVFTAGGSSPSASVLDTTNGTNDAYFDSTLPASTWAVTYLSLTGPDIWDRDVAFNSNAGWSTTGSGGADFRSVATHEFGHVLGLGHESVKPAVMVPFYDGFSLVRTLRFDDEDGCRFLYPAPPPPPPPPDDADLVISNVTFTPTDDVAAGDEILVTFTMGNVGTDPTGTFAATAYLVEDGDVTPDDLYLRAAIQTGLAPGATRDASIRTHLPDVLEPRTYRIGVILDAQQAVFDRDRSNNAGVASHLIEGGGDALVVGLGSRVTGQLLSFGNESFAVDLTAGTKLRVRATVESSLRLRIVQESNGSTLVDRFRYRRTNGKLTAPADDRYIIHLANGNSDVTTYELVVGAKTIKHDGTLTVGLANQVHFPGYQGAMVDAKIRSRSDARPTAEWAGIETPQKVNRKGTKLKLARVSIPVTGPLVLGLSSGEGPSGEISYRVRLKIPKKGPLIRR